MAYRYAIIRAADQPNAAWTDCFTLVGTTTASVNPVWVDQNGLAQLIASPKATWDQHRGIPAEMKFINQVAKAPSCRRVRPGSAHTAPPSQSHRTMDPYQQSAARNLPVLYMPMATTYEVTRPTVHGGTAQYNPITTDQWYNNWRIGS